jgi:hypothetical protein
MLPAHVGAPMKRSLLSFALLAFAAASVGCSSSDDGSAGPAPASTDDSPPPARPAPPEPTAEPTPTPPPFHPAFPTVESRGGPVIAAPKIVPIVFAADPMKDQIVSFTQKLAGSQFWKDTASEYGVGALTAADPIVLSETPASTMTSAQIETWLAGKLTGASPAFGAPDASAL